MVLVKPLPNVHVLACTCDDLRLLWSRLNLRGSPFGHPVQVSIQVQPASTCKSVWPGT